MPQIKLTKTAIDKLPPCLQGQKLYFDTELHGFGVRVSRTKKSFFVQKAINHSTVRTTLGSYGVLTLEQARKKAQKTIAEMIDGKNPNQAKQDNKHKGLTVSEVHDSYIKAKKYKLKQRTIYNYKNACGNYFGDWLDKPMAKITKHMVADRHAYLTENHGAACANNAMRVLRLLYNYAHVLDESLPENPVNYLSRTNTWNRVERRKGVVKPAQLATWHKAVCEQESKLIGDYLKFVLFTGMRRREAATLAWNDVDMDSRTILLRDTKNRDDHLVPMSEYVYRLLQQRKRECPEGSLWVFPSCGRSGHLEEPKKVVHEVARMTGITFTVHDLRRTFATMGSSLNISEFVLKRLLNHKISSDITGGYVILDIESLREPMERIAQGFLEHINGEKNGHTTNCSMGGDQELSVS